MGREYLQNVVSSHGEAGWQYASMARWLEPFNLNCSRNHTVGNGERGRPRPHSCASRATGFKGSASGETPDAATGTVALPKSYRSIDHACGRSGRHGDLLKRLPERSV
jgi:hypothetical protein